ncbi:DUF4197 domain-containing protein [Methylophaga sp. OBS4]|uniref:DUF4197 domain-containing protein n=1 Tax=Methylophaga sp. OBS4 TaxID=2991935 RepID=UPI00224CE42F|nr:DUF4197 domain-containing protein [Methylophaga sp. OBS4]MCX4187874.1 DUF4197 domain-containing protein [Methylophaga sp. OBS4]
MNMSKRILISLAVSNLLLIGSAQADWKTILNDLGEAGKTFLPGSDSSEDLDTSTIISGLKEALSVGSQRAIDNISQTNGFLDNPQIRIPMPPQVEKVGSLMRQFGMSELADEFETSMNHAAEKAAPEATDIVVNAIKDMTIDDAKQILNGPDDAATQYFREQTSDRLTTLFRPAIKDSLDQVGSTHYYNQLNDRVSSIPVVGENLNVNLPDYVTEQALNGLFTMLALEEKKIRENPAARTTELLKKVFQQQ